jgi:hypothetical protein
MERSGVMLVMSRGRESMNEVLYVRDETVHLQTMAFRCGIVTRFCWGVMDGWHGEKDTKSSSMYSFSCRELGVSMSKALHELTHLILTHKKCAWALCVSKNQESIFSILITAAR